MNLAKEDGLRRVIVESDNKPVIQVITGDDAILHAFAVAVKGAHGFQFVLEAYLLRP